MVTKVTIVWASLPSSPSPTDVGQRGWKMSECDSDTQKSQKKMNYCASSTTSTPLFVFQETTGMKIQKSLQVTGVQSAATEADGAAHHSRQSQDSQQDSPPVSLWRMNENNVGVFHLISHQQKLNNVSLDCGWQSRSGSFSRYPTAAHIIKVIQMIIFWIYQNLCSQNVMMSKLKCFACCTQQPPKGGGGGGSCLSLVKQMVDLWCSLKAKWACLILHAVKSDD